MMNERFLGIELGSTRIKSVLIDETARVLANGVYEWKTRLADGFWTYPLEEVWRGLQTSYARLNANYREKYGENIAELTAIGISAMMHGYLAFDKNYSLLVPFRTWQNTNTEQAAAALSEIFCFNIPQRWSVAHYYQAVLNREDHVKEVHYLTTLAGYVHYKLTGRHVLGVGDASGMFPVRGGQYDDGMLEEFNGLLQAHGIRKDVKKLLPQILTAGDHAGMLTQEGALLLDPSGKLKAGAIFCPPEGDAGTGMVATDSIKVRTANVSAGTSAFLMVVLEKEPKHYYREIDMVTTPTGEPVAMVHVNNFTGELNSWTALFEEITAACGSKLDREELYRLLYRKAGESDEDCGGLVGYNFLSGEPIVRVERGRPLMVRESDGRLNLANFMQMQLYSALGALSMGVEILHREGVRIDSVCGHGGFFKTDFVGQNAMSAALNAPVTVMKNAGEGGAWGIALLALYAVQRGISLGEFLDGIFAEMEKTTVVAEPSDRTKFSRFMQKYRSSLPLERLAGEDASCWKN